jgi:hypothetical protein
MWRSRSKDDLIFEVWEKLDCENVGREELEAIGEAVAAHFGESAVDTPMTLARKLADEGAELRHSEIMQFHLDHFSNIEYEAVFRNIIDVSNFAAARRTLRELENLRRLYTANGDRNGQRLVEEYGRNARRKAIGNASSESREIAEWFAIWLQSPELFETWIKLRTASADFKEKFPETDINA